MTYRAAQRRKCGVYNRHYPLPFRAKSTSVFQDLCALGAVLITVFAAAAVTISVAVLFLLFIIGPAGAAERHCPPHLRCGCWLATYLHIPQPEWRDLWVARNWAHRGTAASKGCVNCVAVFRRKGGGHVGLVKGWDANGNPIVLSDLGSGQVETLPHPKERLLALRWVE